MRSLKIQPDPKKKEIKANQTHKTKTKHIKKKKKLSQTTLISQCIQDLSAPNSRNTKQEKKMDLITNLEEKSG
jgi:hypothetical protein